MNKTKSILALISALVLSLAIFSCGDNKPNAPSSKNKKKTYTQSRRCKGELGKDWIYFNFATGKEVSGIDETNFKERTDWDIAIHSFYFRANCGTSGKGKGGGLMTNQTRLSEVKEAPTEGYVVDKAISIWGWNGGLIKAEVSGNPELNKMIEFSGPPPKYTPSDNIFIIRTADGKYAKVKMISYIDDSGRSGIVSFDYVYQADGSTKLD